MTRQRRLLFLCVCVCVLVIAGCRFFGSHPHEIMHSQGLNRAKTLSLGLFAAPDTLDWSISRSPTSALVFRQIMRGLVRWDVDANTGAPKLASDLAKHWSISGDDAGQVTFKLDASVRWSDGHALDAADFVRTMHKVLNPDQPSHWWYLLSDIKNAVAFHQGKIKDFSQVGIAAVDSQTLKISFVRNAKNDIAVFSHPSLFPTPEDEDFSSPKNMVVLGAYAISRWNGSGDAVLKPRVSDKHLWSIFLRWGLNADEASRYLKNKELDGLIEIPPTTLDQFSNFARQQVKEDSFETCYIAYNVQLAPTKNPIIRRSLSMAIDRNEIIRHLSGMEQPVGEMIPPGLPGFESNRGVRFDPDFAKVLLKRSSRLKPEDTQLKLWIPGDSVSQAVAQSIQTQIKRSLGFPVVIVTGKDPNDIDDDQIHMAYQCWRGPTAQSLRFLKIFSPQSPDNLFHWSFRKYDDLIKKMEGADEDDLSDLFASAQHILTEEEMPVVPLFSPVRFYLIDARVKGFVVDPLGILHLSQLGGG